MLLPSNQVKLDPDLIFHFDGPAQGGNLPDAEIREPDFGFAENSDSVLVLKQLSLRLIAFGRAVQFELSGDPQPQAVVSQVSRLHLMRLKANLREDCCLQNIIAQALLDLHPVSDAYLVDHVQ